MFQKFRKVGPKKISKKYFLRKMFIEFPNKNIFRPTFSREKIAKISTFRDLFLSRKCWLKKYFVRKFNEFFEENIFSKKIGPTVRNFWIIAPHSKVYIFRGWS